MFKKKFNRVQKFLTKTQKVAKTTIIKFEKFFKNAFKNILYLINCLI